MKLLLLKCVLKAILMTCLKIHASLVQMISPVGLSWNQKYKTDSWSVWLFAMARTRINDFIVKINKMPGQNTRISVFSTVFCAIFDFKSRVNAPINETLKANEWTLL